MPSSPFHSIRSLINGDLVPPVADVLEEDPSQEIAIKGLRRTVRQHLKFRDVEDHSRYPNLCRQLAERQPGPLRDAFLQVAEQARHRALLVRSDDPLAKLILHPTPHSGSIGNVSFRSENYSKLCALSAQAEKRMTSNDYSGIAGITAEMIGIQYDLLQDFRTLFRPLRVAHSAERSAEGLLLSDHLLSLRPDSSFPLHVGMVSARNLGLWLTASQMAETHCEQGASPDIHIALADAMVRLGYSSKALITIRGVIDHSAAPKFFKELSEVVLRHLISFEYDPSAWRPLFTAFPRLKSRALFLVRRYAEKHPNHKNAQHFLARNRPAPRVDFEELPPLQYGDDLGF